MAVKYRHIAALLVLNLASIALSTYAADNFTIKGSLAAPIRVGYFVDEKLHAIREIKPLSWKAYDWEKGESRIVEAGAPFVFLRYRSSPGIFSRLSNRVDAFPADSFPAIRKVSNVSPGSPMQLATYQGGKMLEAYTEVIFASCPQQLTQPTLRDCVAIDGAEVRTTSTDGYQETKGLRTFNENVEAWFFARNAPVSLNSEIVSVASSMADDFFVVADAARAARQAELRKQNEARQLREAAQQAINTQRAELERKRVQGVLKDSRPNTVMFCESGDYLLSPGKPITTLAYTCDLVGSMNLRDLMSYGWEIDSEVRTPQNTMGGMIGYHVSLRMRKAR